MLEGQVSLITGAGRGIGRAVAIAFARQGAKVACVARTLAQVEDAAAEIRSTGGQALALQGDVSDPRSVQAVVSRVENHWGPVDILVNNAGAFAVKSVLDTSLEDWDHIQSVNARGPFMLVKAVLPGMVQRRSGCIINIASMASLKPYPEQAAYCASKHALLGFSKVLADEMRAHNVRVTAICPGGVDTDLVREQRPDWSPEQLMSPEDVAEAAVYVANLSPRCAVDVLPMRRWPAAPI
ncbi:MAG: SDR family oxidoreductase [Armatimonadetes bacterium]|nr:SDR family oxidoreductase [Armatimonadota bacterium]